MWVGLEILFGIFTIWARTLIQTGYMVSSPDPELPVSEGGGGEGGGGEGRGGGGEGGEPKASVVITMNMSVAIVDLLDQAADLDKKDLPPHFEKLSTELRSLQKYVSDSTVFLTSYDFKIAQKVSKTRLSVW